MCGGGGTTPFAVNLGGVQPQLYYLGGLGLGSVSCHCILSLRRIVAKSIGLNLGKLFWSKHQNSWGWPDPDSLHTYVAKPKSICRYFRSHDPQIPVPKHELLSGLFCPRLFKTWLLNMLNSHFFLCRKFKLKNCHFPQRSLVFIWKSFKIFSAVLQTSKFWNVSVSSSSRYIQHPTPGSSIQPVTFTLNQMPNLKVNVKYYALKPNRESEVLRVIY